MIKKTVFDEPIDIVIPWVNGQDKKFIARKNRFLNLQINELINDPDRDHMVGDLRYEHTNEIKYNLRSIINHMPWIRYIWLITDDQYPEHIERNLAYKDRIKITSHQEIFKDFEYILPVFNSKSILKFAWRINGLSNKFIYANDDFFVAQNVYPNDFFNGSKVLLEGKWFERTKNMSAYHETGFNSIDILNYSDRNVCLFPEHIFYPMLKNKCEYLFNKYKFHFISSASHKFINRKQFKLETLFYNYGIKNNFVEIKKDRETIHFDVNICRMKDADKISFLLELLVNKERKFFCINDYKSLASWYPKISDRMEKMTGQPIQSEILTS